jgi:dTDP-4-dehydrorhamnose reductase
MKVAVTGSEGRLGSALVELGCEPLRCDITKPKKIEKAFEQIQPGVVINCAAWTDVDGAEDKENYDDVMAVNLRGPANLRLAFDGLLIQISTGYVFNGADGPNKEDDLPGPLNIYGWSKFGGEAAARVRESTIVVRTLDLFGVASDRIDFVRSIRDILELGAEKELPDNLYGVPTYIPHISEALLEVAARWTALEAYKTMPKILHIAGDLTLSRFEWGRMIAETFGYDPELILPTSEIKGIAQRPTRGGLNVDQAKKLMIPIYSPQDGLAALKKWEQARGESVS